jgi:hypothetical protein
MRTAFFKIVLRDLKSLHNLLNYNKILSRLAGSRAGGVLAIVAANAERAAVIFSVNEPASIAPTYFSFSGMNDLRRCFAC